MVCRQTGQKAVAEAGPNSDRTAVEIRLAVLMRAAQDGDPAAYQRLLRACLPMIAWSARRQGVPRGQLDDVVQDVLLTVHRVRHTYDPARPFLPWLRAITQRRAVDALRRHGRQHGREVHDPAAYEGHADTSQSAAQMLESADHAGRLRLAIAALPDGQREAVERLALHEQSLDEAAAESGRSKGALKVNLHRALKALRGRLGGGPDQDV
jgi:RNA polymerase sigma factor (sigma-70 family)